MYEVRILRRATKDIAKLPQDYIRLVSRHIDYLVENPRPADAKKLRGRSYARDTFEGVSDSDWTAEIVKWLDQS